MSTNLHVQHFVKTQNRGCWGLYTFRIVLRCFRQPKCRLKIGFNTDYSGTPCVTTSRTKRPPLNTNADYQKRLSQPGDHFLG